MKKTLAVFSLCLMALSVGPAFADAANDLSVFRPAVDKRTKTDPFVQAMDEYATKYKAKVNLVRSDWNNWPSKIITRLAAGDPIDVIFGGAQNFPAFYTRGYAQPIDGYVNLKTPNIAKAGMDQIFKFDGKYYLASNWSSAQPWFVIYNKTLMEDEGIAEKNQPLALYKAGKWNWENYSKLAQKLTVDTDKDGKTDRWGVNSWNHFTPLYMNGTSLTTVDAKGQAKLNLDDPRVLAALDFLSKGVTEGWYNQNNDQTCLQTRKAAMYVERSWIPSQVQKETKDVIMAVPLPYGPGNKEKKNFFMLDGYGIGAGSKKQAQAGKFIEICLQKWYKDDIERKEKEYAPQIKTLLAEMRKNQFFPEGTESILENVKNDFIGQVAWGGVAPATAIAQVKPLAQQAIDDANLPPEKIVKTSFKDFVIDFEDGDIGAFKVADPTKKSVALSVVSGDQAIAGKSLLVKMDSAKDGEFINAVMTDPDKYGIVGWRNYRISFDFKPVNNAPNKETNVYFKAWTPKSSYGNITYKYSEIGTYTAMGEIRDVFRNGKWALLIGGHFGGDIVIDNIRVEEVK